MGNMTYQFKRFCRSVDREMLIELVEQKAPELVVDWSKVLTRNVDALYHAFIALPPEKNGALDNCCRELYETAGNEAAAVTIHSLAAEKNLPIPPNFNLMSVNNQTLWLYLHCPDAWEELMLWCAAETKSGARWFHQHIPDASADGCEYTAEQIRYMEEELRRYILLEEGRGYYCHCHPVMYRDSTHEECFIFSLSDHPRSDEEWSEDGELRNRLRHGVFEIVMLYNRDSKTLKVKANGVRRFKIGLCRIWAHCMRNAFISDPEAGKNAFLLNQFRNGNVKLPLNELWGIESAEFTSIGFAIAGNRSSGVKYEDAEGKLKEKIDYNARFGDKPLSAMDVYYVRIRVCLDRSFGRSRRQTVEIYCDRNNIPSLNISVQKTLNDALVKWGIAA